MEEHVIGYGMKIKICGLTRPVEADFLNEANVDYAGFVFYEKSKRNIDIDKAREIAARLDKHISKVAVMVSPDVEDIREKEAGGFDILQIHKELRMDVLKVAKLPIWYAMNITDEEEAKKNWEFIDGLPKELADKIQAVVVDAPQFGSGQTFDWQKSKRLKKAGAQSPPGRMFVLAGGLNASNVKQGIEIFEPDIVDVSSKVEGQDGKDRELILQFVEAVRG